jgi:predicted DNA-binding protein
MVRTSSNPRVRAVQVRLTPEEMKTLQALAKKDQRSISNYIRWLIEKEAKKS